MIARLLAWLRGPTLGPAYDDSGAPLRCPDCGSSRLRQRVLDRIENIVCEGEEVCSDCRKVVGYWAYGSYDPCFMAEHRRVEREDALVAHWRAAVLASTATVVVVTVTGVLSILAA